MIIRALTISAITFVSLNNVNSQSVIHAIPKFVFVAAQDGKVGSTMTLEDLQKTKQKKTTENVAPPFSVIPAAEPSPALRYRLYPAKWELQKTSALLHFTRAQLMFHQFSKEDQHEWQMWSGRDNQPSDEELGKTVDALKSVFDELHALAMSEDFSWDHRIRDLRGPDVYMYMLTDVQEVRTMARLLTLKIRHQIKQKDFDGAVSSIRDGIRLGEFVGQGETLIQKLVGIACLSIMREGIKEAISTPGCPNLYWALASIPQPLIDISESVLWELSNIHQVLPVLGDAEQNNWTEAEAPGKWASAVEDLRTLSSGGVLDGPEAHVALAIASVSFADDARQRLLDSGFSEARLKKLPTLQIVLIDASRELRRVGDELGKAHLLPSGLSRPLLQQEENTFREWLKRDRHRSVGAVIAGLLFPAVRQAKEAEIRTHMCYHRLMTLEALRMHAAEHDGNLPDSLDDLSPVPALPDVYTGQPFEYQTEQVDGRQVVKLKAAGPANYKPMQTLTVKFPKAQ